MRARYWAGPLILAAAALIQPLGNYVPLFAIWFADTHWNWTIAAGSAGPSVLNGTTLEVSRVPRAGWFQPAYQCAEFVARAMHAGGVPVPLPPRASHRWPIMVNVDRLLYYLDTHGWICPIPTAELKPGDIVAIRYPLLGQAASPTVWSHLVLVVHAHPLLIDAHNAAFRQEALSSLLHGSRAHQAWAVNPYPIPPVPHRFRTGGEVQIAWRDLWTSSRLHLYWGQLFRVAAQHGSVVSLQDVPGTVPAQALAATAATPVRNGHVIIGATPARQSLIATKKGPVPGWTGRVQSPTSSGLDSHWQLVKPFSVRLTRALAIEPIPGEATLPKDYAGKGSVTVVDAVVRWRGQQWAQIEWRGARQGLGFVPWTSLRAADLPVVTLHRKLMVWSTTHASVTINPPATTAYRGCQIAYAGSWTVSKSCSGLPGRLKL